MDIHEIYNLIAESMEVNFTGAGVIFCTKTGKVLILKKDNKMWGLPGGKPENNESPRETAIREAREETGIEATNLTQPIITNFNNRTYYSYICILNDVVDVTLSTEHKKYDWVNIKDLKTVKLFKLFRSNLKKIVYKIEKEISLNNNSEEL
jgi:8-oxo-dGTP pyrophosphatase MutT (NUDIX family)